MNKKRVITIAVILILIILGTVLYFTVFQDKVKFEEYNKYSTIISVSYKVDGKVKSENFRIYDDRLHAMIISDKVEMSSYIKNDELYYQDGNTFYKYKFIKSYRDLYPLISNLHGEVASDSNSESKNYTVLLKSKDINNILDCLYFGKKTSEDAVGDISAKDDKIENFSLNLYQIEGYDEIKIDIKFESLNDNFKIDISVISEDGSSLIPGLYKFEYTNNNPFEIITGVNK